MFELLFPGGVGRANRRRVMKQLQRSHIDDLGGRTLAEAHLCIPPSASPLSRGKWRASPSPKEHIISPSARPNETLAMLTNSGREAERVFPGKGRLPDHNQSPGAPKRWKQL